MIMMTSVLSLFIRALRPSLNIAHFLLAVETNQVHAHAFLAPETHVFGHNFGSRPPIFIL